MEAHSVYKPIENAAVRRAQSASRLHWRKRRYGQLCLTQREYEAMTTEMRLLAALPTTVGQRFSIQKEVA